MTDISVADALALVAMRAVERAMADVQEEWDDHSNAAFMNDRFTQVEGRLRVALAREFEQAPILARLGVTEGR